MVNMWRNTGKKGSSQGVDDSSVTGNGDDDSPEKAKAEEIRQKFLTEMQIRRMEFVMNASRGMFREIRERLDNRRNYEKECGHPETNNISAQTYQDLYDRDPIAARAVEVWPKECWQTNPIIYEDESEEKVTEYERRLKEVANSVGGNNYNSEANLNVFNEYLCRWQIQAGIGRYGVLFIGVNDGLDPRLPVRGWKIPDSNTDYGLSEPDDMENPSAGLDYSYIYGGYKGVYNQTPPPGAGYQAQTDVQIGKDGKSPLGKYLDIQYMRVFPESKAKILRYETDRRHPRHCQPVLYEFTINDNSGDTHGGQERPSATVVVHWSRCLHLPSKVRSDEVHGTPVCQTFLNRLIDLKKLYGGSAEMYWQGALPPIIFKTDPALGGDVDIDLNAVKNEVERLFNGLQRYARLNGVDAETLAVTVVDPTPQIDKQIEAICIDLETPIRIFKGSERGNLASEQDDENWKGRVRGYNERYTIPRVVRPFYNRLIDMGVTPVPEQGYKIFWPDISTQTNTDKAAVAERLTRAIATYLQSGAQQLVPPMYFLTTLLGGFFTRDEAEVIVNEAEKWVKKDEEVQIKKQKRMIDEGLVADPTIQPATATGQAPKTSAPSDKKDQSLKSQKTAEKQAPQDPRK